MLQFSVDLCNQCVLVRRSAIQTSRAQTFHVRSYEAETMHERSAAMSTAKTLLAWLVSVLSGSHAALRAGSMLHSLIVLSNDPLARTSPLSFCAVVLWINKHA